MKRFLIRKQILQGESEILKQKIQVDKGGESHHKKEFIPEKFMLDKVSDIYCSKINFQNQIGN